MTKLPIIDADGHVFEPFSMWPDRLLAEFHDRMWTRERRADGTEQVQFYGHATNMEWTVGALCTPGGLTAEGSLDTDLDTEVRGERARVGAGGGGDSPTGCSGRWACPSSCSWA